MKSRLTPAFVSKATVLAGAERTYYWCDQLPGFGLAVMATGSKSFVFQFRIHGRSRRMTFPIALGLDAARREARKALGKVAAGTDPLQQRRDAAAKDDNTLKAICAEYLKRGAKGLRSHRRIEQLLRRLILPAFGNRQVDSIRRSEIVKLLDVIEDRHGSAMATSALADTRRVLNWHASRSDEFRSPIRPGMARTSPKQTARSRFLSDDEIRAVWRAADAVSGPFGFLLQFILLTATRRTEAANMVDTEIVGSDWIIPASRYKTKVEHIVPLSRSARKLLASVPRFAGSPFIFTVDGRRPFNSFTKAKDAFDRRCVVKPLFVIHDLRRTARTLMSRAGVDANVAELCLGHAVPGIRATYDRHSYYAEKAAAFEALAEKIDEILKSGPQGAKSNSGP